MKDERLRKLLNAASLGPRPGQLDVVGLCAKCKKAPGQDDIRPCPIPVMARTKYVVYECDHFAPAQFTQRKED